MVPNAPKFPKRIDKRIFLNLLKLKMFKSIKNGTDIGIAVVLLDKFAEVDRLRLVVVFALEEACLGVTFDGLEFWGVVLG